MNDDGRLFSGLHETVLPLCYVARSIFDNLRNSTTKKAFKKRVDSGTASKINGRPDGRITGTDMRHLLLLLPFLSLTCCRTRWTNITVMMALTTRALPLT